MRTKVCIYCGRKWGISNRQVIPPGGYECPWCEGKRKRAQQLQLRRPKEKLSQV